MQSSSQKEGFITTGPGPDNTILHVDQGASQRDGCIDYNRTVSGDNLGCPNNPINLAEGSESEVDDDSLRAENATFDTGLFDGPISFINSPTCASPPSSDGNDFPETAPRLPLAKHGASPDIDAFDEGGRQEVEQVDQTIDENEKGQFQMDDVATVVTTESASDTLLDGGPSLAKQSRLFPFCDPSASHDKTGSRGDCDSDSYSSEPDNRFYSDQKNWIPPLRKRKQSFSSSECLTQKKRKFNFQHKSTRRLKSNSKPRRRCPTSYSHSPRDQISNLAALSSAEGRLPSVMSSPVPSASQAMRSKMSSNHRGLSESSGNNLPTLMEITFRPQTLQCFSFTALIQDGGDEQGVSFAQLTRLIESTGHVGKIDDLAIKPLKHQLFLVTGLSQQASSRLSSSGETMSIVAKTSSICEDGRGNDNENGLSKSDPDLSNDDAESSSKDKPVHSIPKKHCPWSDVDEQRLIAYKKEGKPWEWIFCKFPGRTQPAIRTRWSMVRPRYH